MAANCTSTTTNILASVKEQELQFERLTRELEAERQIVANQLERCRLGAESPGAVSISSSEKSLVWRSADSPAPGTSQLPDRLTDSCPSPTFGVRGHQDLGSHYSPDLEQGSLRERSAAQSRSSTQMNSYSDSGYQEVSGYYSNTVTPRRSEGRSQSTSSAPCGSPTLGMSSRAEGQTSSKVGAGGRVMRRVSSVPSRAQSPLYPSPSRPPLRSSLGSPYSSPIVSEPKPLSSIFPGTTLPPSSTHAPDPLPGRHADDPGTGSEPSPTLLRSGMTAQPQHYGTLGTRDAHTYRTHSLATHTYDIFERMVLSRPDSLTGLQSSYSQHSHLGQEGKPALSPERHITPIYEDRTFQNPLLQSPTKGPQNAIYRTNTGLGTLPRTASQYSTPGFQRGPFSMTSLTLQADPYPSSLYPPPEPKYPRHAVAVDNRSVRSPSIDSIHKDPREFAWRDPELPEVIHMLQHHFPSVQANAAAYIQHLCYGNNHIKAEVCRQGGVRHLVDLLDHKALEVQRCACGALRNLVFGRATDDNKVSVRNSGGIPALLRLLWKTSDTEVRELVTGVLWNLSSCDAVKMTIVRDALSPLTNTVIIPHSGWGAAPQRDDLKLKLHSSLVLRNTSGCLRNLSSAGEEARRQMRCCEGLIDSLLYIIKTCVNTSDYDSKIVENCVCTLRNLSYRLELEMPPSRLLGAAELGAQAGEAGSKLSEYTCWGLRRRRKRRAWQDDKWDGVGPIPGFSGSPKGVEMLWHPSVVKPYLTLLAESSSPPTLEGAAGALQNLSAGSWRFACYIRAAVRKEKGLPILVELLRMDSDRVVCSVATALRNMALDARNKELIGKYAMRDLVTRLPGNGPSMLSDETVAAVCCALHEVTSRNMENARALANAGGIDKLVNISRGRGERYSMKVVKAAAQVLNTLWQYRDLRTSYKKDGWNQAHFITPISTLERDRYRSQPSLPTETLQMSPVIQSGGSATSSPAVLGIRGQRMVQRRAQSSMQLHNYYGDYNSNRTPRTGSGKQSAYFIDSYSSPTREDTSRSHTSQQLFQMDEALRRPYDPYGVYLSSPVAYDDLYLDEPLRVPVATEQQGFKSNTNYVDFYSSTRRPGHRAQRYPASPDSWV